MTSVTHDCSKGSRSGFLAKCFFGGLGYGRQTTLVQETRGLLALPPLAARPTSQYFLEEVWLSGLGTPDLPKKHLAKTPTRDLSEIVKENVAPKIVERAFDRQPP